MLDETLPDWVKVSKKWFDRIKSKAQNAKNNKFQARPKRSSPITLNESNKLLQTIKHSSITYEEALKKIDNIREDIKTIINLKSLNPTQIDVINILYMVDEIFTGKIKILKGNNGVLEIFEETSSIEGRKSNKQPDTTDKPGLESEKFAAQRKNQPGHGLKILTPSQMLSRLTISLAQLKAGNNSEKPKNEIRQLLYSLYRSKKLTK